MLEDHECLNVLQWTSNIPTDDHRMTAREKRTLNTGKWILKKSDFKMWTELLTAFLMWIHGIPGAGKTKLISAIIDFFIHVSSDERTAVINKPYNLNSNAIGATEPKCTHETHSCFFYFLRTQDNRRQPSNVLRSFIKQLALANNKAYAILCNKYNSKKRTGFLSEVMSVDESEEILKYILASLPMTILILDALDDCFVETRFKLIEVLNNLIDYVLPVKVLISSRRDGDIKEQLIDKANIIISATDNEEEIIMFIQERITKHRASKKGGFTIPQELEYQIVTNVQEKSSAMFQWATLHIDNILSLNRRSNIEKALSNLPKDLEKNDDDIFNRIENSSGSLAGIALRAVQWIIARYGTTSTEILGAVCQNPEDDEIHEVDIDVDTLLLACHNLILMEEKQGFPPVFRFAHSSI